MRDGDVAHRCGKIHQGTNPALLVQLFAQVLQ